MNRELSIHQKAEAVRDWIDELTRERDRLRAENERMREALEWYGKHVTRCNAYAPDGDAARASLAADIGKRARAALDGGADD